MHRTRCKALTDMVNLVRPTGYTMLGRFIKLNGFIGTCGGIYASIVKHILIISTFYRAIFSSKVF